MMRPWQSIPNIIRSYCLTHEPVIDLNNYRAAIDLSLVLQMMGDQERASMLLERS